ncbi:TRAP transporter small permease [Mesorhizobium sp. BH1-1-5]|uniref:TRAP transporter small permease n=1 Tax=Mesorhizobium sp. BH1-1-5 TaxID=2876661 RepID=UPI001CCE90D7|nr:TRAP transporter small permease [Mesorhizobium sp. BH1-1-5]MBZ9991790.1 TRAP transporter small permease [Mesorhizobium sp. BH1-1-5]
MANLLASVGNGLRRVLGFLVGAALLAIVLLVCIQVFSRYFIGAPTPELAEISRILFIWMTFLGAALLVSQRQLIVIDLLHDRLSSGIFTRLKVLVDIATAVFLVSLAVYARHLMIVVGQKIAPATGISFDWFYGALLAFSVLGLFFILERLFGASRAGQQTVPAAEKPVAHEGARS